MSSYHGYRDFLDAIAARRSYYKLSAKSPISDDQLLWIVGEAVKHTPTAFNSQSGRAVLVLGDRHQELWDVVFAHHKETLKGDADRIERNRKRFENDYKSGYGTVVFFEDQAAINKAMLKSPDLAHLFPVWSQNSAGGLQINVWTALRAAGLVGSLQHFTQVSARTEAAVQEYLAVPPSWQSTALLPFGTPAGPPGSWGEKTYESIEDRVWVVGAV